MVLFYQLLLFISLVTWKVILPKLTVQIIIVGIVIVVAATINITGVQARQGAKILQISVRPQGKANYHVDTDLSTIPAISIDIVADKINDQSSAGSNPLVAPLTNTEPPQVDPNPPSHPAPPANLPANSPAANPPGNPPANPPANPPGNPPVNPPGNPPANPPGNPPANPPGH